MIKNALVVAMAMFMIFGCESTEDEKDPVSNSFATANIKTGPAEYFSFTTNASDTLGTSSWDIKFTSVLVTPGPGAPTISHPYFEGAADLGFARVAVASLADVTEVPGSFSTGVFTTVGFADAWYTSTDAHIVEPLDYVYVVNTADGKYPAFEITNYYDDMGESGAYTIAWKYLSE